MAVYVDPVMSADEIRGELFRGSLIVLTGLPAVGELAAHYREALETLFAPHAPESEHQHFSPAELATMLGRFEPRFIHRRQVTRSRPGFTDYVEAHDDEFADSPGLLRGSVAKCVEDLRRWRDTLGLSYWSLGPNIDAVAPIVSQLSVE